MPKPHIITNKTKFQIGEHVTLKYASENPGQVMSIDTIRSNARGKNECQLIHLTKKNPLQNYDWFNEEILCSLSIDCLRVIDEIGRFRSEKIVEISTF